MRSVLRSAKLMGQSSTTTVQAKAASKDPTITRRIAESRTGRLQRITAVSRWPGMRFASQPLSIARTQRQLTRKGSGAARIRAARPVLTGRPTPRTTTRLRRSSGPNGHSLTETRRTGTVARSVWPTQVDMESLTPLSRSTSPWST